MRAKLSSFPLVFVFAVLALSFISCGGGGGSQSSGSSGGSGGSGGGGGTGGGSNGPLAVSITSITLANAPGQSVYATVTLTVPAGFSTAVTGTVSGIPSGISIGSSQAIALLPGSQNIVFYVNNPPIASPGVYPLTITATAGAQQVSGTATLTITQAPPIGITVPTNSLSIAPGQSNSIDLQCVTAVGQYCSLSTTITGLPTGITVSPTPPFVVTSQGTVITFNVASSVPFGQYPITFVGSSGAQTVTFQLTLVIQDGNFWLTGPSPSTLALRLGTSSNVTVNSSFGNPTGTPNYKAKLSVSGLPGGTSVSFTPDVITPGQSVTLMFSADLSAPVSHNNSILISATPTDGGVVESTTMQLDVIPKAGQLAKSRSDIVPMEGDIVSAVYDPAHKLVFGANSQWNRVEVVSPATKQVIARVGVPSPLNLSLSLDGTKVLVGTHTSQVYWIDTSSLQVVASSRFALPAGMLIGNVQSVPLANQLSTGELIVEQIASNMETLSICSGDGTTCKPLTLPNGIGKVLVSANGRKVVIGGSYSQASATVYDAATASLGNTVPLNVLAIDPTGSTCVATTGLNGSAVMQYDAQLSQQGNLLFAAQEFAATGALFSADGKTLYLSGSSWLSQNFPAVTYTIDVTSGAKLGVAPALATWLQSNFEAEVPYAVDESGMLFGGLSHGLAIDDATFYNNEAVGSEPIPRLLVQTGPINAATQVPFYSVFDYTPDVYFGGTIATSSVSGGSLTSLAPASSTPGPVNVKMEFDDGTEGFQPWAYTYGPWLQYSDSGADTDGGATASVTGLGLGTDPSKVQVSVNGTSAQVVGISSLTVSRGLSSIYPFPSSIVSYIVPPGAPGLADVTVTTSAGQSTLKSVLRYSQIVDYTSSDKFTAVLYDRGRNQLYLTAGNHVDVFDLSSKTFGAPITPPTLAGHTGFAGLTLTPDGSKLLVANLTDGSLAVINPDVPASATAIAVFGPQVNGQCILGPLKVAATSDGRALVALGTSPVGCGLAGSFVYSVNLSTGVSSNLAGSSQCGVGDVYASRDASKVVLMPPNFAPCIYDVAAGTLTTFGSNYATSATISGDGTLVAAPQYTSQWDITDLTGATIRHSSLPDVFPAVFTSIPPAMNDSGSLMYLANGSPTAPGFVDIVDVNRGDLRSRIRLAESIQSAVATMAVDPTDARIFLITDKGLTVITTSGVPLSVGTVSPNSGTAGVLVTLRGSGFQAGMTAVLNGVTVSVSVSDPQTAQFTVPLVAAGATKLTLTNPDGQSYTLEGAFTID